MNKRSLALIFSRLVGGIAVGILFQSGVAQSYPDMIRHNYVNCTACHASPTGGGLMNPYGRAMSNELLSTWGSEKEAGVLHGLLGEEAIPEWLLVGGNVRGIQTHRETPTRKSGRWFLMQAMVELGVVIDKFTAVMAIGEAIPATKDFRWVSTRFYAMWNPKDELAIRVGRFNPIFGVPVPYHTLPTRTALGFNPGQERDTFEAVWSGEKWNMGASVSKTPQGPTPDSQRESLTTVQVNRNFNDSYRVGASLLRGTSDASDRTAAAVHGLLGFSKKWAYITEFDLQKQSPKGAAETTGLYHFSQLIYEATKGVNVYLLEDYQKSNMDDSNTLSHSAGLGLRLFPRPHFEIDTIFSKRRTAAVGDRWDDEAWFLVHYYF